MPIFRNFTLLPFCKFLINCLINHCKSFFVNLESIKKADVDRDELLRQKPPKSTPFGSVFNSNHLFPLLFSCFIIFDTVYGLSQNDWQYSSQGLPEMLMHRMYPLVFHQLVNMHPTKIFIKISQRSLNFINLQSDIIIGLAIFNVLSVNGFLLFDPLLEPKFLMYLLIDQKSGQPELIQNGKGKIKFKK